MITALLILAALVVLMLFVGLVYACCTCSITWFFAICNNSFGFLAEVFCAILSAIADANR